MGRLGLPIAQKTSIERFLCYYNLNLGNIFGMIAVWGQMEKLRQARFRRGAKLAATRTGRQPGSQDFRDLEDLGEIRSGHEVQTVT